MDLTTVIKKPLITEKSHLLIKEKNQYSLVVDKNATKNAVKKAIAELFGLEVLKVRIVNVKGKPRRAGRQRRRIITPGFKKAIVSLKQGEKIPLFEFEAEKNDDKNL